MITISQEKLAKHTVLIQAVVPVNTPGNSDIYVAGDFNAWNPCNPQYRLERVSTREYRLAMPVDFEDAEFKFTRGSWETVECAKSGEEQVNRELRIAVAGRMVSCEIESWSDLLSCRAYWRPTHTVSGDVRRIEAFYSPQLNNFRDVLVYRPPGYAKDPLARFPVIYMHDGQNLFDEVTAYAGEWGMDELSERLAREDGLEQIVVAVNHMGRDRLHEYCPWLSEEPPSKGWGERYMRFLVQTLKPAIDAAYRTKPEPEHTAIIGSSLGGLISLYAGLTRRDVFGFAGALSPSVHFGEDKLRRLAAAFSGHATKFYLDYGAHEFGGDKVKSKASFALLDELAATLRRRGAEVKTLLDPDGTHNEACWARRMVEVLRWFHE